MPAERRRSTLPPSSKPKKPPSRLVILRATLRDTMNADLGTYLSLSTVDSPLTDAAAQSSGDPKAKMKWTPRGYAKGVVYRRRRKLIGWPVWADIAFANLSDIPGGEPVIQFLFDLWNAGTLRFVDASEDDLDLAKRRPMDVCPGVPPELPAPQCWGPYPRDDRKRARARPVTNPHGLPLRRKKLGAITPKLILDEPVDEADEVESEFESD